MESARSFLLLNDVRIEQNCTQTIDRSFALFIFQSSMCPRNSSVWISEKSQSVFRFFFYLYFFFFPLHVKYSVKTLILARILENNTKKDATCTFFQTTET